MRSSLYLFILGLCSCTLLITQPGSLECDAGSPSRCEGNTLVVCLGNVELRQDCGDGICQAQNNICAEIPEGCGDGIIGEGEQCDDTNLSNGDSCLNTCQDARCGDGFIQSGVEQCDDSNQTNGDGCSSICQTEGGAVCGDGIVQGNEQCDDDNASNTDACTNICKNARCGDGFVRAGVEQCDDGNTNNNDACSNSCVSAQCGNGVVNVGEQCDDGNGNIGDLIADFCDPNCTNPTCGNGVLGVSQIFGFPFPEDCDDGNLINGDGCDSTCFTETAAVCGNGTVEAGEQCDDGDTTSGDGCSSTCQTEVINNGSCQAPVTIGFNTINGNTDGLTNIAAGSCQAAVAAGGGTGGDIVFRFTATSSGTRTFSIVSTGVDGDHGIILYSVCATTELGCIDVNFGQNETETINLNMNNNQSVFVMISGFAPNTEGPFTLTIN
jgi:cysteine-rich repeat protein